MRFKQMQRFILAKKFFGGYGNFKFRWNLRNLLVKMNINHHVFTKSFQFERDVLVAWILWNINESE